MGLLGLLGFLGLGFVSALFGGVTLHPLLVSRSRVSSLAKLNWSSGCSNWHSSYGGIVSGGRNERKYLTAVAAGSCFPEMADCRHGVRLCGKELLQLELEAMRFRRGRWKCIYRGINELDCYDRGEE